MKRLRVLILSCCLLFAVTFALIIFTGNGREAVDAASSTGSAQIVPPVNNSSSLAASKASTSGETTVPAPSSVSPSEGTATNILTLSFNNLAAKINMPEGLRVNQGPDMEGRIITQDTQVVPVNISPMDGSAYNGIRMVGRFGAYDGEDLSKLQNANGEEYEIEVFVEDYIIVTYSTTMEPYTYFYWGDYMVRSRPTPGIGGPFSYLNFIHLPTGFYLEFPFPQETSFQDVFDYYSKYVSTMEIT